MKVCITGGTSAVGINLASALRSRGDTVRVLVRRTSATEVLYRLGCELVEGDVSDAASVHRAAEGCEVFVHAAARVGAWGARESFFKVNVRGTETAVRAAQDAGVGRFVLVSCTAVYGHGAARELTESLPLPTGGSPYADSKCEAERVLWDLGGQLSLPVTAVRPCRVYGPYDRHFLPRLASLLRRGRFVWLVDPETPVNLVHASNAVDVMLRLMEHPGAPGEIFNVSDGAPVSQREVVETVCRQLRVSMPTVRVPTELALVAARGVERLWRTARLPNAPPITVEALDALARGRSVSIEKAVEQLGYHPAIQTLEGIAQACDALT